MKFQIASVVATLVALSSAAAIAPPKEANAAAINVPVGPAPEANADEMALYICQDSNFNGRCEALTSTVGQCYNLYNGWNDQITSLGPDAGFTCTLFDDYGCNGGHLDGIVRPGIYNLADYNWNDRASAYRCIHS